MKQKISNWEKELLKNITELNELHKFSKNTKNISKTCQKYPLNITQYYLNLINKNDHNCPIRKQVIPHPNELKRNKKNQIDPIRDKKHSPCPNITHRYSDRCLLYVTNRCAVQCRFCFRKNNITQTLFNPNTLNKAFEYIQKQPKIREVILSGGDPLILNEDKLASILEKLSKIKHVKLIRIHTRIPTVLPSRITQDLIKTLKAYSNNLWLVVHINHPQEITTTFINKINLFKKNGIPLLSQTVLLKDINDNVETLKALFYKLIDCGIKPYYLHHTDLAIGTSHFQTSIKKGKMIMRQLRSEMSGICIPQYMVDGENGKKVV